jgi:hypothetical protein
MCRPNPRTYIYHGAGFNAEHVECAVDDEPIVVGMDDQVVARLVGHALGQGDLDMTNGPPGRRVFACPPEFPDRSDVSIAHAFVDHVQ